MQTWRPEDFITYMYHSVANADLVVDAKEVEVIQKSVTKLMNRYFNGVEYDYDKSLAIVTKTLQNNPHLSKKEIINTLAQKFSFTKEMKIDIISDLTDITQADDQVLPVEHSMLAHIKVALLEEPTKKEKLSA
ncbi:MAG: hypothetical protein SNJ77_06990 [Cytophagales bacterium]